MRSKVALSALFLSLALAGCKSKPAEDNGQAAPPPAAAPAPAPDQTGTTQPAAAPAPAATGATQPAEAPAAAPAPAPVAEAAPPPPPPPPPIVPAGTAVSIRTASALGSKLSQPGDTFQGTTTSSIRVKGETLIPAGSAVSGVVVDAKTRGKIKGEGDLSIRLTAINVHGQSYPISTATLDQTLKGKGKRTAITTGAAAGGGALIGGLAGGGKGAGIGLGVGAAAGFLGGTFTGNKQIEIPAESVLTFTLSSSLHL
jgi:glucose/arabinose dehydrogenase